MVALGAVLFRHVRRSKHLPNPLAAAGLVRGPAAVRDIVPRTILNKKISGPRPLAPGWKMIYTSIVLGTKFRLRVTMKVQRTIENVGGFDRYIFYTPDEELKSELALTLKKRMHKLVSRYPSIQPPPLDKRKPKPLPKKLPIPLDPVEISQTSKYQYFG